MGTFKKCLLVFAWLLQNDLAQAYVPLLASSNICRINPTQTTIALEKPYCFYTNTNPTMVYLYVVMDGAATTAFSPLSSYSSTKGGSTAPYVAAKFTNPNCVDIPVVSQIGNASVAQSILDKYVVRVGNDVNCFNIDPCNGPLLSGTKYSFKYVFYDTNLATQFQSDWSSQITTKSGKATTTIDTWPGRRSGGMIVLTSILSVLTFFVFAALIAAVITNLMTPSTGMETTTHESRTTHSVPQKTEETAEYATSLGPGERYPVNPQV